MARYELTGDDDASVSNLAALYATSSRWLIQHGTYDVDRGTTIQGAHRGIPIMDSPAYFQRTATGANIRRVTPEAARILEIGAQAEFVYSEAHFVPAPVENADLVYYPAACKYSIDKPAEHPLQNEMFTIHKNMIVGKWVADRLLEYKEIAPHSPEEIAGLHGPDKFMVLPGIPIRQYAALRDITDHFDDIFRQ